MIPGGLDSRRGSLFARSRGNSMSIGSASRRGSYQDGQGSSRQTVAMVTDDPQHKAQVRDALTGAFGDEAYNYNGNGGECKYLLF